MSVEQSGVIIVLRQRMESLF